MPKSDRVPKNDIQCFLCFLFVFFMWNIFTYLGRETSVNRVYKGVIYQIIKLDVFFKYLYNSLYCTYIITNPVHFVHLKYVYRTVDIFVVLSAVLFGRLLIKKINFQLFFFFFEPDK